MDYKELVQELRGLSLDYGEQDGLNTILYLAANAIEDLITNLTASNEVIAKYRGQIPKWIPVTERLPDLVGDYLLYRPHFWGAYIGQETICYWSGKNWSDNYRHDAERFIPMIKGLYWMPLPEPPKGGE